MPPALLRRPVLRPVGGIDYSQPATYLSFDKGFPSNIRVVQNELRKREGTSALSATPIAGTNGIVSLAVYPTQEEVIRLFRFSKTKMEMYNPSTAVWDDKTGASSFSGGDEDYFDTTVAENKLVGCNYINVPWTYTDGDAARAALGGSPPKSRFLMYLSPYLVAGYVELGANHHLKVQWTDSTGITVWGSGLAGSALLAHDSDPLKGLKNLNEFGVAYKKNSIYLGRKVDTSDVLKWDLAEVGTGLMNHRSVVEHQGLHYFMALNDFRVFNGVRSESIGGPVRDYVFLNRNTAKDKSHFALHVKDYEEIWFFVVMSGQTYPQRIWKFNYRYNFWYEDTCPSYRHAVEWFQQSSVRINDLVGSIDAQANRIDDYLSITNSPSYVFGDNAGLAWRLDRSVNNDGSTAIDGKFDTIDFVGDTFERYKRWLMLDLWGRGNSVRVFYSTTEGSNWKSIGTITFDGRTTPYRLYLDVVAEKIRFRFINNTASETFWIRQFYPYYLVREEQNA